MENAAEALKIAFAISMFVMALTLSISSFSQANNAVNAIITEKDRDVGMEVATMDLGYEQYVYVQPSDKLTRIVGIETVISSLYRVPEQNLEVHFFNSDGTKMDIYELVDKTTQMPIGEYTNYIDLASPYLNFENLTDFLDTSPYLNFENPTEFLDILIGGENACKWNKNTNSFEEYDSEVKNKYKNRLVYDEGFYERFKNARFEEMLGEYEQGTGTAKITKRVITYVLQ